MSILPIFIPHAGCPHQCVFCNQKTISGQKLAAVAGAKEQLARWRSWLRPSAANEAAFYGGSFTGLPLELQEELLTLTDALLAEGFIGSVRLSTRPDYIDEERLQLLQQHGVRLVELGVQSLDDRVLAAAERGHTAAQVAPAVALLKRFGFQVGLQLMVGMPEQSFASVQETVRKAIAMHPDVARIYPLLVIKGTPLAADYAAGCFVPLTLEEAVTQAAWAYRELTEAGNILAGPFHPAMGELVKSRVLRDKITPQLAKLTDCGAVDILCPARLESKLRGQKSCNLRYWEEYFPSLELQIIQDKADEIRVCPHVNPLHQL